MVSGGIGLGVTGFAGAGAGWIGIGITGAGLTGTGCIGFGFTGRGLTGTGCIGIGITGPGLTGCIGAGYGVWGGPPLLSVCAEALKATSMLIKVKDRSVWMVIFLICVSVWLCLVAGNYARHPAFASKRDDGPVVCDGVLPDREWIAGHWQLPPNSSAVWVAPRWEQQGNAYRFTEGYWN